jgi:hypothetical protein
MTSGKEGFGGIKLGGAALEAVPYKKLWAPMV